MTDKRRRRWIAWDIDYNDGLGNDIRAEFGGIGMLVFNSFVCACKKNATQGRMSYSNDTEALMAMGIAGMPLVDEDGERWELNDLWLFLARRRIVRKEKRGRVTTVIATKWENWQNPHKKGSDARDEGGEHPEGEGGQTSVARKVSPVARKVSTAADTQPGKTAGQGPEIQTDYTLQIPLTPNPDPDLYPDPSSDMCSDPDPDTHAGARTALDHAIDLSHEQREAKTSLTAGDGVKLRGLIDRLKAMCRAESQRKINDEAIGVIGQAISNGVPLDVLESAINELGKGSPVLPRALVPVLQRHCQRRGLPAPMIVIELGKKVS